MLPEASAPTPPLGRGLVRAERTRTERINTPTRAKHSPKMEASRSISLPVATDHGNRLANALVGCARRAGPSVHRVVTLPAPYSAQAALPISRICRQNNPHTTLARENVDRLKLGVPEMPLNPLFSVISAPHHNRGNQGLAAEHLNLAEIMPSTLAAAPAASASPGNLGELQPALNFKIGVSGAHSARTMMLDDLPALIAEQALTLQGKSQNLRWKRDVVPSHPLWKQIAFSNS